MENNLNNKNGSVTLIAVFFLILISVILGYQIMNYQNELWIDHQLINHYHQKMRQETFKTK